MYEKTPCIVNVSESRVDRVERLIGLLRRYSFVGLVAMITTRFEIGSDEDGNVTIGLFAVVPDRKTREMQEFSSHWSLSAQWFDQASDFEIRTSLEKEFQRLWYHEYEESVCFDGQLVRDPHSWADIEKYHAELLQLEEQRKVGLDQVR
ncbi:hypothetical protein Q9Q95_13135 [Sphingomonas sp. DG1-23]|uniref:hypothetical protein n=1 Tax=Sphingomonas sp. DG1-23 TaxID=3068316 RepID=UPI00273EF532|nr:hypothetical protein [Sphingomonas sp. DG1-23]MDP5279872.1 hypothetical protein [Sphingomonas sp. DG1-23]